METKLINAVKRNLGGDKDGIKTTLQDVANHGADGGYNGFIYYTDTIKFFKNNRAEIVALVKEYADEFGQTPIEFVASFNCLKTNNRAERAELEDEIGRALYGRLAADDTQVPNALAWFALEEVARHETDN